MNDDGRLLTLLTAAGLVIAGAARGSRGVVRRGQDASSRLRSPSSPAGAIPLTAKEERDAWDAGYEEASLCAGLGGRAGQLDPESLFVLALTADARIPVLNEEHPSFWEWEYVFREGVIAYGRDHGVRITGSQNGHSEGSLGIVRTGRRAPESWTYDDPGYAFYVVVDDPADPLPGVLESGWEFRDDALARAKEVEQELEGATVSYRIRIMGRRTLAADGIDPRDDGRWRVTTVRRSD